MKALIPAAGLGTRWHPWSRVVPKELLPLGRSPAIQYVLDEAVTAGIMEIGVVIGNTKKLIRSYVDKIWKTGHPEVQVMWFYQTHPRGVTDALLSAMDWVRDEPTAVLYPDEIHPQEGGLQKLCRAYETSSAFWIGLTHEKPNRRQMALAIESEGTIIFRIVGSNGQYTAEGSGYGTGRYILKTGLSHIERIVLQRDRKEGEELDDDLIFAPLWKQGVRGLRLPEPIYDLGAPENWCLAVTGLCESGDGN